jgi:hypothetical protein
LGNLTWRSWLAAADSAPSETPLIKVTIKAILIIFVVSSFSTRQRNDFGFAGRLPDTSTGRH